MTITLHGKNAIITGASSGIGAEIALDLASRGCNVVLVARREEKLRNLQTQIEKTHGVQAHVVPLDLTAPGAADALYQQTEGKGMAIDILVNNAGFAVYGDYSEIAWEQERKLYELDMIVLTQLTRLFLKNMLVRKQGYIMQVASVMGLMPVPTYTIYAAAKAFVVNYSKSLSYELRNTGVSVTVIAPGTTDSEFLQVAGQPISLAERLTMMKSSRVARDSVNAMLKRRVVAIIGLRSTSAVWLMKILPTPIASWLTYTMMKYGQ